MLPMPSAVSVPLLLPHTPPGIHYISIYCL
jgi:hypothetical protein